MTGTNNLPDYIHSKIGPEIVPPSTPKPDPRDDESSIVVRVDSLVRMFEPTGRKTDRKKTDSEKTGSKDVRRPKVINVPKKLPPTKESQELKESLGKIHNLSSLRRMRGMPKSSSLPLIKMTESRSSRSQVTKSSSLIIKQIKNRSIGNNLDNPINLKVDLRQLNAAIATEALEKFEKAKESNEINESDKYKVTTYECTLDDDQKVLLKEFAEKSYNGVKPEGFRVRQNLLFEASKSWVNKIQEKWKQQALDDLEKLNKQFLEEFKKFQKSKEAKTFKKLAFTFKFDALFEASYKAIHDTFEQKIAQYAKDTELLINNAAKEKVINQSLLAKAEKDYVYKRSRPIIVNIFKLDGKKFVAMQTPATRILSKGKRENAKTIPSTIRNRPGLVNYVISSFGEVDESTKKVTIYSEGIRHSSYPPKSIKDQEYRQTLTCRNVEECLRDIAERKLIARKLETDIPLSTGKNSPLVVSLRSMLLLTTGFGDTFLRNSSGGEWVGDAEGTQLRDSAFGLSVYKGRTFMADLGKKFGQVWIKADISFMNLGTNLAVTKKGIGRITKKKKSEQMINATGFIEFDKELKESIMGIEQDFQKFLSSEKKISSTDRQNLELLWKISSSIRNLQTSKTLEQTEGDIERRILKAERLIKGLSDQVLKTQKQVGRKTIPNKLQDQLRNQYNKMRNLQDSIGAKNQKIVNVKKKLWSDNKKEIAKNQVEFNTVLETLLGGKLTPELKKTLKLYRDLVNNAIQARSIYHEKKYKKPGKLNDFQALFIGIQQLLGNSVEFFCKSAEDRTGRVDDRVIEMEIFKVLKGHSPRTPEDYNNMNMKIAPFVHQYSPSQDNTEQNSGARGEQVTGAANPEQKPLFNTDRMHSQIAKRIFGIAEKKQKPSKTAEEIMSSSLGLRH